LKSLEFWVAKRQDGKETKLRVLNAACDEFSYKGYRDATVADICKLADANMASVNYYFGDKANLYVETWRHIYHNFRKSVLKVLEKGTAEEKLRRYVRFLIENLNARDDVLKFSRLYLMELLNPTGLIDDIWDEIVDPNREKLHGIIRELMDNEIDDLKLVLCELSIINQCRVLSTIQKVDLERFLERPIDDDMIEQMIDHIIEFSLAGIRAIGGTKD
jgi:AcrR family transcriptional regulator